MTKYHLLTYVYVENHGNFFYKILKSFPLLFLSLQDPELVCYDLKYALRLCSEYGHKKACVHIYTTMGLYEEAVDLALEVHQ